MVKSFSQLEKSSRRSLPRGTARNLAPHWRAPPSYSERIAIGTPWKRMPRALEGLVLEFYSWRIFCVAADL